METLLPRITAPVSDGTESMSWPSQRHSPGRHPHPHVTVDSLPRKQPSYRSHGGAAGCPCTSCSPLSVSARIAAGASAATTSAILHPVSSPDRAGTRAELGAAGATRVRLMSKTSAGDAEVGYGAPATLVDCTEHCVRAMDRSSPGVAPERTVREDGGFSCRRGPLFPRNSERESDRAGSDAHPLHPSVVHGAGLCGGVPRIRPAPGETDPQLCSGALVGGRQQDGRTNAGVSMRGDVGALPSSALSGPRRIMATECGRWKGMASAGAMPLAPPPPPPPQLMSPTGDVVTASSGSSTTNPTEAPHAAVSLRRMSTSRTGAGAGEAYASPPGGASTHAPSSGALSDGSGDAYTGQCLPRRALFPRSLSPRELGQAPLTAWGITDTTLPPPRTPAHDGGSPTMWGAAPTPTSVTGGRDRDQSEPHSPANRARRDYPLLTSGSPLSARALRFGVLDRSPFTSMELQQSSSPDRGESWGAAGPPARPTSRLSPAHPTGGSGGRSPWSPTPIGSTLSSPLRHSLTTGGGTGLQPDSYLPRGPLHRTSPLTGSTASHPLFLPPRTGEAAVGVARPLSGTLRPRSTWASSATPGVGAGAGLTTPPPPLSARAVVASVASLCLTASSTSVLTPFDPAMEMRPVGGCGLCGTPTRSPGAGGAARTAAAAPFAGTPALTSPAASAGERNRAVGLADRVVCDDALRRTVEVVQDNVPRSTAVSQSGRLWASGCQGFALPIVDERLASVSSMSVRAGSPSASTVAVESTAAVPRVVASVVGVRQRSPSHLWTSRALAAGEEVRSASEANLSHPELSSLLSGLPSAPTVSIVRHHTPLSGDEASHTARRGGTVEPVTRSSSPAPVRPVEAALSHPDHFSDSTRAHHGAVMDTVHEASAAFPAATATTTSPVTYSPPTVTGARLFDTGASRASLSFASAATGSLAVSHHLTGVAVALFAPRGSAGGERGLPTWASGSAPGRSSIALPSGGAVDATAAAAVAATGAAHRVAPTAALTEEEVEDDDEDGFLFYSHAPLRFSATVDAADGGEGELGSYPGARRCGRRHRPSGGSSSGGDGDDDDEDLLCLRTPLSPCPSSTAPRFEVLASASPLSVSAVNRRRIKERVRGGRAGRSCGSLGSAPCSTQRGQGRATECTGSLQSDAGGRSRTSVALSGRRAGPAWERPPSSDKRPSTASTRPVFAGLTESPVTGRMPARPVTAAVVDTRQPPSATVTSLSHGPSMSPSLTPSRGAPPPIMTPEVGILQEECVEKARTVAAAAVRVEVDGLLSKHGVTAVHDPSPCTQEEDMTESPQRATPPTGETSLSPTPACTSGEREPVASDGGPRPIPAESDSGWGRARLPGVLPAALTSSTTSAPHRDPTTHLDLGESSMDDHTPCATVGVTSGRRKSPRQSVADGEKLSSSHEDPAVVAAAVSRDGGGDRSGPLRAPSAEPARVDHDDESPTAVDARSLSGTHSRADVDKKPTVLVEGMTGCVECSPRLPLHPPLPTRRDALPPVLPVDATANISGAMTDVAGGASDGDGDGEELRPLRPYCACAWLMGCRSRQEDNFVVFPEVVVDLADTAGVGSEVDIKAGDSLLPGGGADGVPDDCGTPSRSLAEARGGDSRASCVAPGVEDGAPERKRMLLVGVFDGHNGDAVSLKASRYISEHFTVAYREQFARRERQRRLLLRQRSGSVSVDVDDLDVVGELADDHRVLSAALVQSLVHVDVTIKDELRHPRGCDAGSTACIAAVYLTDRKPEKPSRRRRSPSGSARTSSTYGRGTSRGGQRVAEGPAGKEDAPSLGSGVEEVALQGRGALPTTGMTHSPAQQRGSPVGRHRTPSFRVLDLSTDAVEAHVSSPIDPCSVSVRDVGRRPHRRSPSTLVDTSREELVVVPPSVDRCTVDGRTPRGRVAFTSPLDRAVGGDASRGSRSSRGHHDDTDVSDDEVEGVDFLRVSIANLGDSRAVVGSMLDGALVLETKDHRVGRYPSERARILANGGTVEFNRVDGCLDVTRGLGDYRLKGDPSTWWSQNCAMSDVTAGDAHVSGDGLPALEQGQAERRSSPPACSVGGEGSMSAAQAQGNVVSNIADVYEWDVRSHDFLIIASDGLWDRMESAQVVAYVADDLRRMLGHQAALAVPPLPSADPSILNAHARTSLEASAVASRVGVTCPTSPTRYAAVSTARATDAPSIPDAAPQVRSLETPSDGVHATFPLPVGRDVHRPLPAPVRPVHHALSSPSTADPHGGAHAAKASEEGVHAPHGLSVPHPRIYRGITNGSEEGKYRLTPEPRAWTRSAGGVSALSAEEGRERSGLRASPTVHASFGDARAATATPTLRDTLPSPAPRTPSLPRAAGSSSLTVDGAPEGDADCGRLRYWKNSGNRLGHHSVVSSGASYGAAELVEPCRREAKVAVLVPTSEASTASRCVDGAALPLAPFAERPEMASSMPSASSLDSSVSVTVTMEAAVSATGPSCTGRRRRTPSAEFVSGTQGSSTGHLGASTSSARRRQAARSADASIGSVTGMGCERPHGPQDGALVGAPMELLPRAALVMNDGAAKSGVQAHGSAARSAVRADEDVEKVDPQSCLFAAEGGETVDTLGVAEDSRSRINAGSVLRGGAPMSMRTPTPASYREHAAVAPFTPCVGPIDMATARGSDGRAHLSSRSIDLATDVRVQGVVQQAANNLARHVLYDLSSSDNVTVLIVLFSSLAGRGMDALGSSHGSRTPFVSMGRVSTSAMKTPVR